MSASRSLVPVAIIAIISSVLYSSLFAGPAICAAEEGVRSTVAGFDGLAGSRKDVPVVVAPDAPDPVDFRLTMLSRPDNDGVFHGSILVNSRFGTIPIKMFFEPTRGIEVVEAPVRLRGRVCKGKPVGFDIVGRLSPSAPRPGGLVVVLKLRYPAADALAAYKAELRAKGTKTSLREQQTIQQLERWAEVDKGGPIIRMSRSFFFPNEVRK